MCLAKVYLKKNDGEEVLLEHVTSMKRAGRELILKTIYHETTKLEADILAIDFENGNLFLERLTS